jgi:hypothetical protein
VKAKEEQHCGKVVDHPPHGHTAHKKKVVVPCECGQWPCICSDPVQPRGRKQEFHCTGKLEVEGVETVI